MTNFEIIAKAFRHNTGKSFLDSGDHYGRHYEKPPIDPSDPIATLDVWGNDVCGSMETAAYLNARCNVDREIQDRFDEWVALEENSEMNWFEAGETFATEVLGLTQFAQDNTYNSENDLTQNYVWEVYGEEGDKDDWLYNDDALMVVYAHTGCDVRGGYAYPLFLRSTTDYAIPVDMCVEYRILEARRDGEVIEDHGLDERWSNGYSSNPSYQLSNDIERVFKFTQTPTTVVVKLRSGEVALIYVSEPSR